MFLLITLQKNIRKVASGSKLFEVGKAFNHGVKNANRGAAYSRLSNQSELRQGVKMPVAGVKNQIVLQCQGRDPHIVRRHRSSLFPELAIQSGVVMCRLVVGEDDFHPILQQEVSERAFVLWLPTSVSESGAKFREYDKGQHDKFRFCEKSYAFVDTPTKIDVSIGVESYPHFQSSSSIRS